MSETLDQIRQNELKDLAHSLVNYASAKAAEVVHLSSSFAVRFDAQRMEGLLKHIREDLYSKDILHSKSDLRALVQDSNLLAQDEEEQLEEDGRNEGRTVQGLKSENYKNDLEVDHLTRSIQDRVQQMRRHLIN